MEPVMMVSQPTVVEEKFDQIPTFYCNQARLALSQFDVTIDVGQANFLKMTQAEGSIILPVDFKARIIMSLQHAKAIAQLIMLNIEKYENDFAPLALLPKAMISQTEEHKEGT